MTLRAVDLFCGAGGLSKGLMDAGFVIAAAVDLWEPALRSYRANFPDHAVLSADITRLEDSDLGRLIGSSNIDLVAGGPPCQGFSVQRIGADQDHRNDLVLAFAQGVLMLRPRMFLMENVPGLLGRRGRHNADSVVRILTSGGYAVRHSIIDAASFGVPQTRRRVFFVGWLRGDVSEFKFPAPTSVCRTVREAISDLPTPPDDFSSLPADHLHRRMRLSPRNLERLSHIPPGGGFESLPVELRVDCHKEGAARIGHRYVYGRLDPDRPAATITARFDSFTRGRFAHPWEDRNITLREGARLQGFPDSHIFLGTQEEIAAQIGNAVSPPLAFALGTAILRHINGSAAADESMAQMAFDFDSARHATVAA